MLSHVYDNPAIPMLRLYETSQHTNDIVYQHCPYGTFRKQITTFQVPSFGAEPLFRLYKTFLLNHGIGYQYFVPTGLYSWLGLGYQYFIPKG